jgi:hypothetical protein
MNKQTYITPEVVSVSVELERGIAQSGGAINDGYGEGGEAGGGGGESGETEW